MCLILDDGVMCNIIIQILYDHHQRQTRNTIIIKRNKRNKYKFNPMKVTTELNS